MTKGKDKEKKEREEREDSKTELLDCSRVCLLGLTDPSVRY